VPYWAIIFKHWSSFGLEIVHFLIVFCYWLSCSYGYCISCYWMCVWQMDGLWCDV